MTVSSFRIYANTTPTEPWGIHFSQHPSHNALLFRTIPKGSEEQREYASGPTYLQLSLEAVVGSVARKWDWVRMREKGEKYGKEWLGLLFTRVRESTAAMSLKSWPYWCEGLWSKETAGANSLWLKWSPGVWGAEIKRLWLKRSEQWTWRDPLCSEKEDFRA